MTLIALWYSPQNDHLRCMADSRISSGTSIVTEMGPKILPVPIVCHRKEQRGPHYAARFAFTAGFTFCGSSTLAAMSTHALGSACTQSLATDDKVMPIRLESVTDLFRMIAKSYIQTNPRPDNISLAAFIFGFCHADKKYRAFQIEAFNAAETFDVKYASVPLDPTCIYLLGSGREEFMRLSKEMGDPGVSPVMREMIKRQKRPDVGGHPQTAVATRRGLMLEPILNIDGSELDRKVTFLGWDVDSVGLLDGYRIGFVAYSPDLWQKDPPKPCP